MDEALRRHRSPIYYCALLAASTLLAVSAAAQTNLSTVRGTVKDASGAVVPDAAVTITELGTNLQRSATSNTSGDFEFPDLKRGTYRLSATAAGFRGFVADNIILESNQTRRVDVILELGQLESQVKVSANAAVIETESAKIQGGFTNERYDNFPIVGVYFDPNTALATLANVQSPMGGYSVRFAGQQPSQIQEGMDGVVNDGIVNQINNMEDTQELQAVMVNNSAEYSRVGFFNLTTKSGTNELHGRGYYYQDNSALDARNFFSPEKTKTLVHTFGGSASGPIRRDKTFFYGSWNSMRVPSSSFYLRAVPTNAFRSGDFTQLLKLANPVVIKDPLTGLPFPNNVIPSGRLNPVSLKVQDQYLPKANLGGPDALTNNFGFRFPYPADLYRAEYLMGRVDHKISENNTLTGRYVTNWFFYVLPGNYPGLEWTRLRRNHHLAVEDTHIFSASLVNTARFGIYQEKIHDGDTVNGFTPQRGDAVVKAIGLEGVNPRSLSAQGFPRMDITGYSTLRVQPGGFIWDDRTWSFNDSMTWTRSSHVMRFGLALRTFSRFDGSVPEGTYGVFSFNGALTGNAYADFLLGLPQSSQRLDPLTNRTKRAYELGLFFQDTYKLSQRLTLDYGIRWDYFGAPTFEDGLMYDWDPMTGNVIVPQSAIQKINPLYPTNTIKVVPGDVVYSPKKTNVVPRLGLAYRLLPETVLRGGYGIYTEALDRYAWLQGTGPYQISETFFNSPGSTLYAFPNPFPPGSGRIPSQSISGFPADADNGRIHQFNVSVEHQIHDVGLRLSYIGSRSRGLNYQIANLNKPQPSLIPFSSDRRPYPQFVNAGFWRSNGEANYNAMSFEVQRKFTRGIRFQGHWTMASSMANYLGDGTSSSTTVNIENPYAPLLWNRDQYTPRHRVSLNATWELPFGRGRHFMANAPRAIDQALGGWTLYYLAFFQTGSWFTPYYSGADPSNTNTVGGLPDRIADGNLPTGQRSIDRWFDVNAFAPPPPGRFGNSGVNILEGPGLHVHHLTVSKRHRITERLSLQTMLAISNLFNHPNFHFPAANISAPGAAGVISSTYGGGDDFNLEKAANRRMEVRVRLEF